jgi:hypothetical protein
MEDIERLEDASRALELAWRRSTPLYRGIAHIDLGERAGSHYGRTRLDR